MQNTVTSPPPFFPTANTWGSITTCSGVAQGIGGTMEGRKTTLPNHGLCNGRGQANFSIFLCLVRPVTCIVALLLCQDAWWDA